MHVFTHLPNWRSRRSIERRVTTCNIAALANMEMIVNSACKGYIHIMDVTSKELPTDLIALPLKT